MARPLICFAMMTSPKTTKPSDYPVLCVKGSSVSVCNTEADFARATPHALRSGWFDGLLVVDSSGYAWTVSHAEKVEGHSGRLFAGLFAPRVVTIRCVYEDAPKQISLQEVQELLCRAFEGDPNHWEAYASLDQLKTDVRNTQSLSELFKLMA